MESVRNSKVRGHRAMLFLVLCASALMSCVDQDAPEQATDPAMTSSQQELSAQCEWWGCPPLPPYGDWTCEPGEERTCPEDCGIVCGDGVCSPGEQCPFDCGGPSAPCGDGICSGNETPWTCPHDCGSPGTWCGDGVCNGNESASSCPSDCGSPGVCGNCICEGGELQSCPTDCGVYIPDQPACPQ